MVFAIRQMTRGFQAASKYEALSEFKNRNYIEERRTVTKAVHPEMEDVEVGDELLVINFTPDDEFVNRVKGSDNFLHQSLMDRIEEMEEDDEDDDGDIVVRA